MKLEVIKDLIVTKLEAESDSILKQWATPQGTATHYFYIDNVLPVELADEIYAAFPKQGDGFHKRKSFREQKSTFAALADSTPILNDITKAIQLPEVIEKISELVGMKALQGDPTLYAGGLSMMFKDDFLNPHIDNSHDGNRQRYRRLNLLYYVTPEWTLENGGNFELWDEKVTVPQTIVAKFNRLVVMETNNKSWHSVSPVIIDTARCCVSNYYFSEISPSGLDYFHVTSFTGRPDQTWKRRIGVIDNLLRNIISKTIKTGRGKSLINKT